VHISLAAEKIGEIAGLPITNSMVMTILTSIILIILAFLATKNLKKVPEGIQNFFEAIIEFLFNIAESVIGNREKTKKYFPLVATLFLFIIINNWLGLLPGVGTIGFHETHHGHDVFVPLLRTGNADLNTTIALATVTMIAVQLFGIIAIGFFKYSGKFINFKNPIYLGIGLLELMGEISRMISFAFRLFGNIFAGEVLLTVIAIIVPYIAPLPFFGLELFVGFIQALVFTMLALVFIRMAIEDHAEAH